MCVCDRRLLPVSTPMRTEPAVARRRCVCVCAARKTDLRNSAVFWSHGRFDKSLSKQGQEGWGGPTVMTAVYRCRDLTVLFQLPSLEARLRFWDDTVQYKGFCLYFIVKYRHWSFCATWHFRRGRTPVKLVGGPGLKFKSESQTHLSKATCAWAELWQAKTKFAHTFFTHLGLQCPLMAARAHTQRAV